MPHAAEINFSEHLRNIPSAVRPTVEDARRLVVSVAPNATEVAYRSQPPGSKGAMWKLVRYAVDDTYVVGIGTYPTYAALFFYRGREIDDESGLLEGGGKDMRFIRLRAPADVQRAAVKRVLRRAFRLAGPRARLRHGETDSMFNEGSV